MNSTAAADRDTEPGQQGAPSELEWASQFPPHQDGARQFPLRWVLASVWLIYLAEPVEVLITDAAGADRVVGLLALAGFVALYLFALIHGRQRGQHGPVRPAALRWAQLGGLMALAALVVPGAGHHALAAGPFVAAVAIMTLPLRQAVVVGTVLAVAAEILVAVVPGWSGVGYGLAVVLASVAVFGMRTAFERNFRLVAAQQELSRLALENERARIAQDLHDILGHSLTVVAIKAELAQRLLDVDAERARTELRDLETLARDALADVRATALGVRGVSLPGEIAAARAALAAAGVRAELPTAADDVASRWRELFAWAIREAVTNLIRHSRASSCTITLTPDSVEILDDGSGEPAAGRPRDGRGLDGLRQRAEALGAHFEAGNRADGPGFRVLIRARS